MSDLVIGVDPGTVCCGVSVFYQGRLVRWGTVRPTKKSATPVQRCFLISTELAAEVDHHVREYGCAPTIVVELPGMQGGRRGAGALLTLGLGVGMILKHLQFLGHELRMVEAQRWTRLGGGHCLPKEERADIIRRAFPAYANEQGDKGLDAADAIGIGAWFLGLTLPGRPASHSDRSARPTSARRSSARTSGSRGGMRPHCSG
jgi:Holliday junction resolvasome RuvABC endonuclease subunit